MNDYEISYWKIVSSVISAIIHDVILNLKIRRKSWKIIWTEIQGERDQGVMKASYFSLDDIFCCQGRSSVPLVLDAPDAISSVSFFFLLLADFSLEISGCPYRHSGTLISFRAANWSKEEGHETKL